MANTIIPELSTGGLTQSSLTEFEISGLKTAFSFADGHAYHDMPPQLTPVINRLHTIWREAADKSIPEMEERFKRAVSRIIQSPVLGNHDFYSLCPTASNSIDIAGAWLAAKNYTVGLLEPAFDNLHLLLKRRNVQIQSIHESDLADLDALAKKIEKNKLKSLFIVSPNNPTGFQLNAQQFRELCELCKTKSVAIVIDVTFRLYSRNGYDEYQILNETGNDYIVIEDTGKTWPTQDTKVSLMAYSASVATELRTLYEEVYLCHSNFSVCLLSHLIERTTEAGVDKVIWNDIDLRRSKLNGALKETGLKSAANQGACPMPVEWLNCTQMGMTDLELVEEVKKFGVALLPGRYFYWSTPEQHVDHVRVSLLRSAAMFDKGLLALQHALQKISPGL